MSMIGEIRPVDLETLTALREDPESVLDFLEPVDEDPSDNSESVEKKWHAIHFALVSMASADDDRLAFWLSGGEALGIEEDYGYGPPRCFGPDEVRAIAHALEPIDGAALRKRFDPVQMNAFEIYPGRWSDDSDWDIIVLYFERMKRVISEAAERGDGIIVRLC